MIGQQGSRESQRCPLLTQGDVPALNPKQGRPAPISAKPGRSDLVGGPILIVGVDVVRVVVVVVVWLGAAQRGRAVRTDFVLEAVRGRSRRAARRALLDLP